MSETESYVDHMETFGFGIFMQIFKESQNRLNNVVAHVPLPFEHLPLCFTFDIGSPLYNVHCIVSLASAQLDS